MTTKTSPCVDVERDVADGRHAARSSPGAPAGRATRRASRRCGRPSARTPSTRCGTKRVASVIRPDRPLRGGRQAAVVVANARSRAQGSGCVRCNARRAAVARAGAESRPWRADRYDFVIVGGGSAGSALGNRLSADPANRVLVLEAGRPDYLWDVFIHMPAALPFPIGSRFYDWKYESEPEPHMNGRRIYHARGKVLGGSSSINGMIFQRGNPLDYERWGADAGMDTWDYAHCLPVLQADGALHGGRPRGRVPRPRRPARPGARSRPQPAVRRVLRGGPAGRLPAHRRRERVPPGGVRAVRPQHPQRPAAVGRPRVPAPGDEPSEPRRRDPGVRHEGPVRGRSGGGRGVPRTAAAP